MEWACKLIQNSRIKGFDREEVGLRLRFRDKHSGKIKKMLVVYNLIVRSVVK